MRRRTDTLAERRAFLNELHRKLFQRDLDELSAETMQTVMQTMADAAVLSDERILERLEQADTWAQNVRPELRQHANNEDEVDWAAGASHHLLTAVLRRELELRGIGEDGEPRARVRMGAMDGTHRLFAVTALMAARA